MKAWTDESIKEVDRKQEKAIVATHRMLGGCGLSIDTVRAIVKSKSPSQSDGGGIIFISRCHENLWVEMVNEPIESLTEDFVEQVKDRLMLQDWLGE